MNSKRFNRCHILWLLLFSFCLLTATGCHKVYSTRIVGSNFIPEDVESFNGAWMLNNEYVLLMKWDDDALKFAMPQWIEPEGGAFKLAQGVATFSKSETAKYLNIKLSEADEPGVYLFCMFERVSDNEIVIWAPNFRTVAQAIETGNLTGTFSSTKWPEAELSSSPEVLGNLFDSDPSKYFDLTSPMILRKLH